MKQINEILSSKTFLNHRLLAELMKTRKLIIQRKCLKIILKEQA